MNGDSASKKPVVSPDDIRRRRSRSIAIALVLGAFVLLFYFVTIAKLGPQILNRAL
jgi:hypothetical protein